MSKFKTPSGDRERIVYAPCKGAQGGLEIMSTGTYDISEYINSFAESCDLELILKRAAAGDMSGFSGNGFYGDNVMLPADLQSALEVSNQAHALFDDLPERVKSQFDGFSGWLNFLSTADGFSQYVEMICGSSSVENSVDNVDIKEGVVDA